MTKEATATKTTPAVPPPALDLAEILEGFAGQIVPAAKLGQALKDGGHKPAVVVPDLVATKAIRQLGNAGNDDKGEPVGFRFEVAKLEESQEVWVCAQHGPAVNVLGFGQFDQLGRSIEADGKALAFLQSREVPVEAITNPAEITKLEAKAEELAVAKAAKLEAEAERRANAGKVDKRALAELG